MSAVVGKRIAIVGGWPGGLTLARLLQQSGAQVSVYERGQSRSARVQGSALDLHENSGLAALFNSRPEYEACFPRQDHAQAVHVLWRCISSRHFPGRFVCCVCKVRPRREREAQAQGGAEVELAQVVIGNLRWSPDGSEVLFGVFSREQSAPHEEERSTGDPGIYVISRLGGVARRIDKGDLACWLDPNGSQVVTAGTDGGGSTHELSKVSVAPGHVEPPVLADGLQPAGILLFQPMAPGWRTRQMTQRFPVKRRRLSGNPDFIPRRPGTSSSWVSSNPKLFRA